MVALAVVNPLPQFFELDGDPLDNGSVYFGTVNGNPVTSPATSVTWDDGTPVNQPAPTKNGYFFHAGRPSVVKVDDDYSMLVLDKRGRTVFYAGNSADFGNAAALQAVINQFIANLANSASGALGGNLVGYTYGNGYSTGVGLALDDLNSERLSVMRKIPRSQWAAIFAGTSVYNATAAVEAAAAEGPVFFPKGNFKINAVLTTKHQLVGSGGNSTFLEAFDTSAAVVTSRAGAPFWTYHNEVRSLCFRSTSKVGVGYTFGRTNPADYVAGDEYFNNTKFYGVRFEGLRKGVQFPFGNIGSEFYSCNWTSNYYGVYALNNKFGGTMHAGNKYFYAGEFNNNDCAAFMHNTADGLYGFVFNGTIFEQNQIAGYFYSTSTYLPAAFNNVGTETNGTLKGGTTTLDQWVGTVNTPALFTNRTWIFDGTWCDANFEKCGVFTDVDLRATTTMVTANECRVERMSGVNGAECTVTPTSSIILMRNPTSDSGPPVAPRCVVEGRLKIRQLAAADSGKRWCIVPNKTAKIAAYGGNGIFQRFNGASGTVNTTGLIVASVNVANSTLYGSSSEYSVPGGTGGQNAVIPMSGALAGIVGQWFVATIQVWWHSGAAPQITCGDLGTSQVFAGGTVGETQVWATIAGIAPVLTTAGVSFQFAGNAAASVIRLSAGQIRMFPTKAEAEAFFASNVYTDS